MLPFQNMTAVQAAFAVVNKGVRPNIPNDCLPVLSEIMTRCWDGNPDVRPPFTEVIKMLENAEMEIITTVRKARFRHNPAPTGLIHFSALVYHLPTRGFQPSCQKVG
ncbi:hypothetical protein C3L33_22749, partial [Rhododendron williamsianum]